MIQVFFLPRRCVFFKLKTAFFLRWDTECFLVKTPVWGWWKPQCHSNIQRFLIKKVHARSHLSKCLMLDFSCSRTCNDLPKITQKIRPTMTIEQCRTGPVKPILTIPSPCLPSFAVGVWKAIRKRGFLTLFTTLLLFSCFACSQRCPLVDIRTTFGMCIPISKGVMSILQAVPGWWNPPSPYYSARSLQGGGPVR